MTQADKVEWIEPYRGYRFETREMTVEAAEQARLVGLCGIDPDVFGGAMDPAGFISLAIRRACVTAFTRTARSTWSTACARNVR
jgi:hypothetical protein